MSGHSKWSQIKHKKALTDAKKGKLFSKIARQITIAARQKGGEPESNPGLRMLADKARSYNMPAENIDRAIKKGTGEIEDAEYEELTLEAYGPGGSALIIEGSTDNRNRTISEIKHLLSENNGKLATSGSVIWLFDRCGIINVKKQTDRTKDDLELSVIDSGAQDLKWLDQENLEVYTAAEELEAVKKKLEENGLTSQETSLGWRPKNEISIEDQRAKEQLEKLFEMLDENDDVSEIYSNVSDI